MRDWAPVVAATDGTSAAFIREVLRQATLTAAERDGGEGAVRDADLLDAVEGLKTRSGRITASILGARPPPELDLLDGSDEFDFEDFDDEDLYAED